MLFSKAAGCNPKGDTNKRANEWPQVAKVHLGRQTVRRTTQGGQSPGVSHRRFTYCRAQLVQCLLCSSLVRASRSPWRKGAGWETKIKRQTEKKSCTDRPQGRPRDAFLGPTPTQARHPRPRQGQQARHHRLPHRLPLPARHEGQQERALCAGQPHVRTLASPLAPSLSSHVTRRRPCQLVMCLIPFCPSCFRHSTRTAFA